MNKVIPYSVCLHFFRHFQRKRHKNKDFSPVHRKFKRKYIPTELKKKELLRPKKELSERLLKYLKRRPRRRNLKKVIPIPENLKFRKATKFSKKEKRQAERFFIKNHRGISDGYNCKERRKKRREQIKNTTKCDQKKELTYSSTT